MSSHVCLSTLSNVSLTVRALLYVTVMIDIFIFCACKGTNKCAKHKKKPVLFSIAPDAII